MVFCESHFLTFKKVIFSCYLAMIMFLTTNCAKVKDTNDLEAESGDKFLLFRLEAGMSEEEFHREMQNEIKRGNIIGTPRTALSIYPNYSMRFTVPCRGDTIDCSPQIFEEFRNDSLFSIEISFRTSTCSSYYIYPLNYLCLVELYSSKYGDPEINVELGTFSWIMGNKHIIITHKEHKSNWIGMDSIYNVIYIYSNNSKKENSLLQKYDTLINEHLLRTLENI